MGHVCARRACTRWTRLVVVNDKCRAYNYVVFSPMSSLVAPNPTWRGVGPRVAALTVGISRARRGVVVAARARRRAPLSSFFVRGFEPTLPAVSSPVVSRGAAGVAWGPPPTPIAPSPRTRLSLVSAPSRLAGSRPPTPRRARRSRQPLSSLALHRLVCPPNWLWVPLCHQAVLGVYVASRGEPGDEKGPGERARRAAGV